MEEFAHAFTCAYIELWMHLESLESTQEDRVARGATLTYLSCFPNFPPASVVARFYPWLKIYFPSVFGYGNL